MALDTPRWEFLVIGSLAIAGFVCLWLLGARGPWEAAVAAVAASGSAAVAVLVPRRPVAAVGVVFLLAVFSRVWLELPVGTMRLEQPALLTLIVAVGIYRDRLALPSVRPLLPLLAAALAYLVVLTMSSALVADQPLQSLRLVAWSAQSMAGGLVAALIVAGRAGQALPWLAGSGSAIAALGLVGALGYLLFGLGPPLIAGTLRFSPKASALTLEPNLYASLLAAAIPLAVEMWRTRPNLRNVALATLLLVALGLGVTRGAYVGLAAGLAVYIGLIVYRHRFGRQLRSVLAMILLAGAVGLAMPVLLLNPNRQGLLLAEPRLPPPPSVDAGPRNELGTVEYRVSMVRLGLEEFAQSPFIGRGAYSFGQRHVERNGEPAVIAIWPLSVAYDSGVIGLAALSTFFVLLGHRIWRATRDAFLLGPVAAFAGSVTVLLVAYLATTALHFAVTWLIIPERTVERPSPTTGQSRGLRWRLTRSFTERSRRGRFLTFMRLMQPRDADRVLDVGVTDSTWRSSNFLEALYPWPGSITAVAPQPVPAFAAAFPDVHIEQADGRRLPFADGSFDIGFSNAVIEHVGSRDQQRLFVAEIVRTCHRSFICTPNRGFPVDPHTLLPFLHWLPRRLWYAALQLTRNGRWATEEMLNPIGAKELLALFPPGAPVRIERQRVMGLTSVLIAVVEGRQDDG